MLTITPRLVPSIKQARNKSSLLRRLRVYLSYQSLFQPPGEPPQSARIPRSSGQLINNHLGDDSAFYITSGLIPSCASPLTLFSCISSLQRGSCAGLGGPISIPKSNPTETEKERANTSGWPTLLPPRS